METRGPKSNSSELLCLSWLPAALMMIRSKMNKLALRHHFPIISRWEIFRRSRAANSVVSGPIWPSSNSSEILCMSSLPASILKRIGSKTEKRWRHPFPHYKSMGAFCCHGNQSSEPICPKTLCSLSPTPVMLYIKFDQDWPIGFRDIQVWKCGGRRTDGRRPLVYYKLTLWVFGSGELKIYRCLSFKRQRPFSSKSRMQFTIWYPPFCQQFTNHRQKKLPNTHKTRFRNKSLFSDIT